MLSVDSNTMEVDFVSQYTTTRNEASNAMGSTEVLPNYNALVGHGFMPEIAEYSADGTLLFDMFLGSIAAHAFEVATYRAWKSDWYVLGRMFWLYSSSSLRASGLVFPTADRTSASRTRECTCPGTATLKLLNGLWLAALTGKTSASARPLLAKGLRPTLHRGLAQLSPPWLSMPKVDALASRDCTMLMAVRRVSSSSVETCLELQVPSGPAATTIHGQFP